MQGFAEEITPEFAAVCEKKIMTNVTIYMSFVYEQENSPGKYFTKSFAVTNYITNFAHSECIMTREPLVLSIALKVNRFC